jgi:translation initiation factor IF-2
MKEEKIILKRPPVVTVLGHVDHGKTTLLDAIRATNVQSREAGGITQRIGASVVKTKNNQEIVFIDTPGHAAFAKMRSCGVNACDLAVLVVASDDGVKPQTRESIKYIKEAQIPFLVAFTKIDLPSARVEVVKKQLAEEGIYLEGLGGDVPFVSVSARNKVGIEELLELILLLSYVSNLEGSPEEKLKAVVIETAKTKAGLTVSAIVKQGKLRVKDEVYVGAVKAKIRGLIDAFGKSVNEILPGYPALILGFEELPPVGAVITDTPETNIKSEEDSQLKEESAASDFKVSLIIKAESQGVLEAILGGIKPEVKIVDFGIGEVTKNDVLMAKTTGSLIFTFGVKVTGEIKKLAESEGVRIEEFDIIYKLFERLDELVSGLEIKEIAKAQILTEFPFDGKRVAGCKMIFGEINIKDKLILKRGEQVLGEVKIISLKKQKQAISKVGQGEEFGILFAPQFDFKVGDVLVLTSNPASAPQINGK